MLGMAAPKVTYGMLTELLTLRPRLEALGSMVWDWQRVSVSVVCELAMSISLRVCFFGHRHRMQTVMVIWMLVDLHGSSRAFWLYGLHICWPLARRKNNTVFKTLADLR